MVCRPQGQPAALVDALHLSPGEPGRMQRIDLEQTLTTRLDSGAEEITR
jgi:hypothetical protein